jgi:hypothetical protein
MVKMTPLNSYSDLFMKIADMDYWFDKRQIELLVFGTEAKRHRRTEILLRRLSTRKRKGLTAVRYGNKLIYTLKRRSNKSIYHSLNCMECLVRFYMSDTQGELIPERHFRGCGSNPDGGMRWNNVILCFEFSTLDQVVYHDQIPSKLRAYSANIEEIEKKFHAEAIVVFILDVPRDRVGRYVGLGNGLSAPSAATIPPPSAGDRFPLLPFCYFVDYKTFCSIPLGQQLTAPIYRWKDGKEYPLINA